MFLTLFGLLVLWNMHGIEVLEPHTIRKRWGVFLLGLFLAAFTLIGPYIVPDLLEFTAPNGEQWGFVLLVFLITVVTLYFAMRTRMLTERLWKLFLP